MRVTVFTIILISSVSFWCAGQDWTHSCLGKPPIEIWQKNKNCLSLISCYTQTAQKQSYFLPWHVCLSYWFQSDLLHSLLIFPVPNFWKFLGFLLSTLWKCFVTFYGKHQVLTNLLHDYNMYIWSYWPFDVLFRNQKMPVRASLYFFLNSSTTALKQLLLHLTLTTTKEPEHNSAIKVGNFCDSNPFLESRALKVGFLCFVA